MSLAIRIHNCENLAEFNSMGFKYSYGIEFLMGFLRTVTDEYIGGLRFSGEIKRNFSIPRNSSDIVAITGPRRVGKTFSILKEIQSLQESGERAVYASFDDPFFSNIDQREFAELVRQEYPQGKVHLFLDEIQEWRNWDHNVRWLHDVKDFYLIVTGSSSSLLSSEIPSLLRGRYISRMLLPLSFSEIHSQDNGQTFRESGILRNNLEEYIKWGGFPEVWLQKSREKLVNIQETMFYRDIIERHGVRDLTLFKEFFNHLLSNYSNPFTWNSLKKFVESMGIKIDTKTVMAYVDNISSSYLTFLNTRFSYSLKKASNSPKKLYLVDPGIVTINSRSQDTGRKIENLVYLQLLRMEGSINYYLNREGSEIDFIFSKGTDRTLVEVCTEPDADHRTKIKKAIKEIRGNKAVIITLNGKEVFGDPINEIPLHKWLNSPVA